jgi:hypothetical protein
MMTSYALELDTKRLLLVGIGAIRACPEEPELNIDDLRLKICGIASLCLFY